jgi:hypothetical protein
MPVPTTPLRLHVTARSAIDTEPPVEHDDEADRTPRVLGSLALAGPAPAFDDSRQPVVPVRRVLELVRTSPRRDPLLGPDELFDVVRTPRADLPAPGPRAGALVCAIMEALTGRRPIGQLVRWLTSEVYDELEVSITRDRTSGWAGRLRRLIVTQPADGVAEVTAVVERDTRTSAVAMRMEGRDGRWVVTALQLC